MRPGPLGRQYAIIMGRRGWGNGRNLRNAGGVLCRRVQASGRAGGPFRLETVTAMLMGVPFADAVGRDGRPERYPLPPERAVSEHVESFLRAIGWRRTGPRAPQRS